MWTQLNCKNPQVFFLLISTNFSSTFFLLTKWRLKKLLSLKKGSSMTTWTLCHDSAHYQRRRYWKTNYLWDKSQHFHAENPATFHYSFLFNYRKNAGESRRIAKIITKSGRYPETKFVSRICSWKSWAKTNNSHLLESEPYCFKISDRNSYLWPKRKLCYEKTVFGQLSQDVNNSHLNAHYNKTERKLQENMLLETPKISDD